MTKPWIVGACVLAWSTNAAAQSTQPLTPTLQGANLGAASSPASTPAVTPPSTTAAPAIAVYTAAGDGARSPAGPTWFGGPSGGSTGPRRWSGAGIASDVHTAATSPYFYAGDEAAYARAYGGGAAGSTRRSETVATGDLLPRVRSALHADASSRSLHVDLVGSVVVIRAGLVDAASTERAVAAAGAVPGVRGVILRTDPTAR